MTPADPTPETLWPLTQSGAGTAHGLPPVSVVQNSCSGRSAGVQFRDGFKYAALQLTDPV